MRLMCVLLVCLACAGCLAPEGAEVPTLDLPPVAQEVVQAPYCPLDRVMVTLLPSPVRLPVVTPAVPGKRPQRPHPTPTSAAQVVAQAQSQARVEPDATRYTGGELVYPWVHGRVYTIYLTPNKATGIFLPPGDGLVSGLYLNPEVFEVEQHRAGEGDTAYDALMIRPSQQAPEVETFLLTTSGRRYLLHLVIGKTGMLAVSFTSPK